MIHLVLQHIPKKLNISFSKFICVLTGGSPPLNMLCSGAPLLIEHDSIGQSAGISSVTVTHCNLVSLQSESFNLKNMQDFHISPFLT